MPGRPESNRVNGRKGGRPKGSKDKRPHGLRDATRAYTAEAVKVLVSLIRHGQSEGVRLAATREILDRGWGRPAQSVTGEDGGAVQIQVVTNVRAEKSWPPPHSTHGRCGR